MQDVELKQSNRHTVRPTTRLLELLEAAKNSEIEEEDFFGKSKEDAVEVSVTEEVKEAPKERRNI